MKQGYLYITLFLALSFFSCQKDVDDVKPTIDVSSPTYLQSFDGFDTLQIVANITDDQNIELVRVSLKDMDGAIVLSSISKSPNTKSFLLDVPYFFDDIQLSSGEYTFDISAFDGENTKHIYIPILYNEIGRERERIVVMDNNGATTHITQLDNAFNTWSQYSITGDFIGGFVNSYDQQIITASSDEVKAFDASSNMLSWNVSTINTYQEVFFNDRDLYVSLLNGQIKSFDRNGNAKFEVLANLNFFGESGLVFENVFLSEQKAISGNSTKMVVYWIASELERHQRLLTEDVVKMYSFSSDKAILFGNELLTSSPKIRIYDVISNSLSIFSDLPSVILDPNPIEDCVQISSNTYLILQNGLITRVDVGANLASAYMTVNGATGIEYDALTNQLFIISGNVLDVYNYSSQVLQGNYIHGSPILKVGFLYNK